jgi:hypothetical protein
MARVPVITSPCPLRWQSMPSAGRDFCGQCQRRVHNLDAMSDAERGTFFATCGDEICVAYTTPHRHSMLSAVGLGIAAATFAGVAMAADETPPATYPTQTIGPTCDPLSGLSNIVVGGVKAARSAKLVDANEVALPDAPDIEEVAPSEWLPSDSEGAASTKSSG